MKNDNMITVEVKCEGITSSMKIDFTGVPVDLRNELFINTVKDCGWILIRKLEKENPECLKK